VRSVDEVRLHPERLAAFTPETQTINRDLKRFLHRHVYSAAELHEERSRAASMIAELFDFFLEHPDRLPASHSGMMKEQPPYRVVCDYIAGMTDSFFRRMYDQMLGSYSSARVKLDSSAESTP
jgi:dGTPase